MKHKLQINIRKTINLELLNQKDSFHIWDDTFYYYIETFLKLPYYSENDKHNIKKKIERYILKLLVDGKLVKKSHGDQILKNIARINKNIEKCLEEKTKNYNSYKSYHSVLTLIKNSEKEKHKEGLRLLSFNKTEIPFFHNTYLKIYLYDRYYNRLKVYVDGLDIELYSDYISFSLEKSYLLVRLKRKINDKISGYFSNVRDLFVRFLDIGINEICTIVGIDAVLFYNNIRALHLRSLEVARELIHFDKHKPPFIPVSRYGRDRKRDLGHVGFPNYYDYIDYSSMDDYGNKIPEYEIQMFNRENKPIDIVLRDLEFLLDFKPIIDNGIIESERFDIASRLSKIYGLTTSFSREYKTDYKIQDSNGLVKSFLLGIIPIFSRLT